MISPKLSAALAIFDDQALATLGNTGLVRRAQRDVENAKVVLTGTEGDRATLSVDGQIVEIGADGPAKATCDCPAAGVCRHRIAAVLFLRSSVGSDSSEPVVAEIAETGNPGTSGEWLEEISLDQARKFAGRPGWRAALELALEAGPVVLGASNCAVTFASLEEPVLIIRGQGMQGIASKASKARKQAYHAAAIIAARRHAGLVVELHEEELAETQATPASRQPSPPDAAFLEQVRSALVDCAQLGFNLAPLPIEERLFELSVSSRADALPRLSTLLRSVAAQMRLRRQRSFEFDASMMLELTAIAYALTFAVAREGLGLAEYLRLAGELRRNYAEHASIELVGCGADLWRSGSGARGVTAHFMQPDTGEFYSVAIARGAGQDPNFNPREAFQQQAFWQSGTMETLCHARILLHNVGLADGGRLASGKEVRAEILGRNVVPDRNTCKVHHDWETLQDDLASRFGLGVDANGQPQMALIEPAETARPQFDDLAQQLIWPVRDIAGKWIALTIDHDDRSVHAIAEVEKRIAGRWNGMMLVRAFQTGSRIEVSPVTLFDDNKPTDLSLVRPVHRWSDSEKNRPDVLGWLQRLRPDPGRALTFAAPPRSAAAVMDAWRLILDRLEAGSKLAGLLDDRRSAHAIRLGDYGLQHLAERVANANDGAGNLAAAYALLVARQQRVALPFLG